MRRESTAAAVNAKVVSRSRQWHAGSIACGANDKTLSRVDLKTNQVSVTIQVGPADSEGGLAAGSDCVWMLTDSKGVLARISPETNRLVAEIQVPSGSAVCVIGEDGRCG